MMTQRDILLIEENHKERASLSKLIEDWGYHADTAPDGDSGAKKLKDTTYRLIIASYDAPGLSDEELFHIVNADIQPAQICFVSKKRSVETAVEMMKAGALDFVMSPVDPSHMKLIIKRAFEEKEDDHLSDKKQKKCPNIVTQDKEMLRVLDLAKQVADSKASVLIQGESGTGKELFARYIHQNSGRRNGSFIAVNCGALPETLLESELFGHERGAFTGAVSKKLGKFEIADSGTILLDEITEMAFHLQSKLLRVLQEQEIDRVGGVRPVRTDVRVIATTNREIQESIRKQAFREDLFYRLNVIPLKIPPLRFRQGDIPLLVKHFIEKYNEIDGRHVKSLTKEAMEILCQFPFQGNVRELENIVERAVLLSDNEQIQATDLLLEEAGCHPFQPSSDFQPELMTGPLKEVEKKIIFHTLDQTNGNRTHAAKILGISVRTLRNKLNEYKDKMETT